MYKFASLLILIQLLLLLCADTAGQTETRIAATWQVQKYDISASLPQSETDRTASIKARLEMKNVSSAAASTVTLRISPAAEVSSVRIGDTSADFTKGEERAGVSALQKIALRIPSVAPGGTLTVTVDYKLNIKDNSGLAAVSSTTAQFLPLSFWYPTPNSWFFARGADHAPFRIAVSGGAASGVSSGIAAAGAFEQSLRGQPFFAAGDWEKTTGAGSVELFIPKGAEAAQRIRAGELAALASEAKVFIGNVFGSAPTQPIRIVAVNRGAGFSGGGTIFVDESVLRRARIDSQTAIAIADGITKMWLGGSVAIAGDGEGAVREGLARYFAVQFIESKFGKDVADVERSRQRSAYAGVAARDAPITLVTPLDDFYYAEVANKGAMLWRLLARKVGDAQFVAGLRSAVQDGVISLSEIRAAFPEQKEFLDYGFDQITDTNLQAGLPQPVAGAWRVALRNTGAIDVTVTIAALLANGERMSAPATIKAKNYGEVSFRTQQKIIRVEIDVEKLYPQIDYSDDVAPREFTESDPLLAVKRLFDKQDLAGAERTATSVLREFPRYDDVRVLLGRALLALGRVADAEREFKLVLDEKLPSARSIAWANVGLADISQRAGQAPQAAKFAIEAIRADAEYGASLAARSIRNRTNIVPAADAGITSFFQNFDRAAVANRKAELQALIAPGEVGKFASGISGQTEQWKTQVTAVDMLDTNTALVESQLTVKLLNREVESGLAVYRLVRTSGGWKLVAVDIFEVR